MPSHRVIFAKDSGKRQQFLDQFNDLTLTETWFLTYNADVPDGPVVVVPVEGEGNAEDGTKITNLATQVNRNTG